VEVGRNRLNNLLHSPPLQNVTSSPIGWGYDYLLERVEDF
jgi:hypothetical protein